MDVTGLILAGGRGSRMGSVDKGLQPFRGVPLVLHVLQRITPQVAHVMINANRNLPAYRTLCDTVVPDQIDGFPGPLAGLQVGLSHCRTRYLVSVPCDAPFLPADLVVRLADGLRENDVDVAVAVTGLG